MSEAQMPLGAGKAATVAYAACHCIDALVILESEMKLVNKAPLAEAAPIQENYARGAVLQDALWDVIKQERFADMTNGEVVGVLAYLQWNFINSSTS